ncbi:MAG TPA: SH3 domain-containing protein [Spirochaetota bacterium]|nr:SH3 domain-containing protein [Spirochaetota bacterium]
METYSHGGEPVKADTPECRLSCIGDGVRIRESPDLSGKPIGTLRYTEEVSLVETGTNVIGMNISGVPVSSPFIKIRTSDGVEGWVYGAYLSGNDYISATHNKKVGNLTILGWTDNDVCYAVATFPNFEGESCPTELVSIDLKTNVCTTIIATQYIEENATIRYISSRHPGVSLGQIDPADYNAEYFYYINRYRIHKLFISSKAVVDSNTRLRDFPFPDAELKVELKITKTTHLLGDKSMRYPKAWELKINGSRVYADKGAKGWCYKYVKPIGYIVNPLSGHMGLVIEQYLDDGYEYREWVLVGVPDKHTGG